MALTLVFAATAFTLAVIGIYGVLTWAVAQRVAEIGVRVALGARTTDVVRMVLTQGGRLIALGLVIGGCSRRRTRPRARGANPGRERARPDGVRRRDRRPRRGRVDRELVAGATRRVHRSDAGAALGVGERR